MAADTGALAGIETKRLVRLLKPCFGVGEKSAVQGVLDREYLGMGAGSVKI